MKVKPTSQIKINQDGLFFNKYFEVKSLEDANLTMSQIADFQCDANEELAHFFYDSYLYDKSGETKTYVLLVKQSLPKQCITKGDILGYFTLCAFSLFVSEPQYSYFTEKEETTLTAIPCLMLGQYAFNSKITKQLPFLNFGYYIFSEYILNIVYKVKKYIGIKYLVLYAADNSPSPPYKLIENYKSWGFETIDIPDNSYIFTPTYDEGCQLMIFKLEKQEPQWSLTQKIERQLHERV